MAIGSALKAAREAAGLSVQDVADQLRMRQTLVRAVEADDFAQCGGAVYARGHIRSIARVVGLDAEPLVAEFDADFGNPDLTEMINDGPSLLTPERKLPWNTIVSVAAGLLLVIAGVSVFNNGSSPSPVAGPDVTPSVTASQTPSPSDSAIAQAPVDGVSFEVTAANGSSWLSVQNDEGVSLHQAIIRRGTTLTFQDKTHLRIVIGNAGAVTIKVNGKELGAPGTEGEVLHLDFTPND